MSAIAGTRHTAASSAPPMSPIIWEGLLPDSLEPEPGDIIVIAGRRVRVLDAWNACGRRWRLELAAM